MINKKIDIGIIITYIYAFILLYSPNFNYLIGINNYILLGISTLIMFIYSISRKNNIISMLKNKTVVLFVVLIIFATAYYMIRTLISGTDIMDFSNLRIVQNLMPILYLFGAVLVYDRLNTSRKTNVYRFIINIALIQTIICILMLFISDFRQIAYNIFFSNHEFNQYISASRLFGICDGDYTYSFQIMQSIIAAFSFIYAYFSKERKYYLFSFIILLSTLLNGRWGIVIYLITISLFMLYLIFIKHKVFTAIKVVSMILIIGLLGYYFIINYMPNTVVLVEHAANDITSFLSNTSTNTETGRLLEMIIIPEGKGIIIGNGYRIFGGKGIPYGFYQSSDIGFVNDMFMGGLIFMTIIYGSYLLFYFKIKKNSKNNSFERVISVFIIICYILANIKGEVFRSTMLTSLLILLLVFALFESKKQNRMGE